MKFYKAHGLANDFIIIDAMAGVDYSALAISLCARHTNIGADGLLVIDHHPQTDFSLRFFNGDGSEAEMSGNGIRCATAVFYHSGRATATPNHSLNISTLSGIKTIKLRDVVHTRYDFEVAMGQPRFHPIDIPMHVDNAALTQVIHYSLKLANGSLIPITAVCTGNPHCTVFLKELGKDSFDDLDWRTLGSELEKHAAFPNRTNVEFVQIISRNEIATRFWERGAGETESSGTGSCGAAIASMINNYIDRSVKVYTPAGTLEIVWQPDDNIMLTGPAEIICSGSIER